MQREPIVRTVLGDISPETLGRTDAHEHLLMRSPLLRRDQLDEVERSADEAASLGAAGIDALVELTTIGLGRDPIGLFEIARQTSLHVVLATGIHREAHYPPEHWAHRVSPEQMLELFVNDLLWGCDGADYSGPREKPTDILAGVIKVGAGYWQISPFERRVMEAAGETHRKTGAPVVCHLELGTAGHQVLDALEEAGVELRHVALAHADRNPDPEHHIELASRGAFVGYDGASRTKYWPDSMLLSCLLSLAEAGYDGHILLGGDVARRGAFRAYGGLPGLSYLPEIFVPRLEKEGGSALTRAVLVENPANFLSFAPPDRG